MSGDPLGVLSSTKVLLNSGPVRVDRQAARKFAGTLDVGTVERAEPAPFFYEDWTLEDRISIVLGFNAINFCSMFPPHNGTQLPLLSERAQCLKELGQGLRQWPAEAILGWEDGATELIRSLILHVPNFNDVHRFQGEEIRFYKRAQVTAKMIHGVLEESAIHAGFSDLGDLTAFADYRVPQILREKRILSYDPMLAERVDDQEEVEAGSHEELAIRACTIWAVEYLRQELEGLHPGQKVKASDVDGFLWLEARRLKDAMRPHHRTRTIYY